MTYLPPPSQASRQRSLAMALSAGAGVALVGAVVWGLITYLTKHELSVLAVVLGLAVGTVVARIRPGDMTAAAGSAVISLLGAVLGTILVTVFVLVHAGIGLGTVLAHLGTVWSLTLKSVDFLGYLFWALAAFFGFRIPLQVARRGKIVVNQPPAGLAAGPQGNAGQGFPQPAPQPFMPPPGYEQPGYGQPGYGQPQQPGYGQPQYGQPRYGQPVADTPPSEPPASWS